ncbi:MAG: Arc family DNA-binding protein [Oscillospiraceae bacterium]|jgi:predicted DNA binding CopG/RHH family protein|nr:Arc family DNA-binding protein [Oscillospiraceae bacterium]
MEREQMTIRLPTELKEKIRKMATERGLNFNSYLLILIDKGLRDLQ